MVLLHRLFPFVDKLISIVSNEDCIIFLKNETSFVPADDTYEDEFYFVVEMTALNVIPTLGYYSIIGLEAGGRVIMQFIEAWHGLSLSSQITRR